MSGTVLYLVFSILYLCILRAECILYLGLIRTPSVKTTNGVCGVMLKGVTNKMVATVVVFSFADVTKQQHLND